MSGGADSCSTAPLLGNRDLQSMHLDFSPLIFRVAVCLGLPGQFCSMPLAPVKALIVTPFTFWYLNLEDKLCGRATYLCPLLSHLGLKWDEGGRRVCG